ncbi:MFS transporter, PPP family, 3-phenylpropionic acid transporter [Paenibacillus macquariensis]|uniref:MFS transporter, PPP family, 3-phenylpropionic acid transporter n=2 Tax=Paenibacillus macquariensis TaxID=948756 RepID=A0ABY1K9M7_9BACL|nr:MFS transporter, PPP family, 3-phenylpropionic acid transporter [Paenibacillus macquariensis]
MSILRESITMKSSLTSLKLFNFFIYGTMVIFTSFFQLYLQDVGMKKFEIGSLMALGPFVSLFANPFWRYCGDRLHNMKRIIIIMMSGALLLVQFVFQADTYAMVYLAMILFFFFQTPIFSHSNSLILGYIEDTPYKFGSFRIWGSIGWGVTAIAVGQILDWTGISKVSTLFTAVLIIAIGAVLVLPPLKRSSDSPTLYLRGFTNIMSNRYFLSFILMGVLVSIPNAMNNTFMSLYITELGGSKRIVGLAVFLSAFLEIAMFFLFDRFMKRKISWMLGCLALVSLLFGLRWLLMAEATLPLQVAAIQVLHCITFGGFFYIGTQLTSLLLPRPYRATGQAVYTLALSGLSGVIGAFIGGWLFQNFGAEAMYRTGMLFALIGAVGFGWMWYLILKQGYKLSLTERKEDPEEDLNI